MASLISKKKGNKLYYYVVESARVDGKPRIVQQTYLGTADRLADLLKERTAPVPVSATKDGTLFTRVFFFCCCGCLVIFARSRLRNICSAWRPAASCS